MTHRCLRVVKACLLAPVVLVLSACGGGAASKEWGAPPSAATVALVEQIKALEASGRLPKLDRSAHARKKAARQMARVQQAKILLDSSDKSDLKMLGGQSMRGVSGLVDMSECNHQQGHDLVDPFDALTANTKERAEQNLDCSRARSGSVTERPAATRRGWPRSVSGRCSLSG